MLDNGGSPREALLHGVTSMIPVIQANADVLDAAVQFPQTELAALRGVGLLTATLPEYAGGLGFGHGPEGALHLARLLGLIAEANLSLARIYEAHVNALQLILRYGSEGQAEEAAAAARQGHLFALWVTDGPGCQGATWEADGRIVGGKAFCSAAGFATRAVITVETPEGTHMALIEVPPGREAESKIRLAGMRAAKTGSMDFTGLTLRREELLGEIGDYLREPLFSAGAWRGSAAALGGMNALLSLHRGEILARKRDGDPHQRARFGQLLMAYETVRLWVEQAALRACLEDRPAEEIVAYVNLARLAVEAACLDAIGLSQRSLGLSAFAAGSAVERVCRDLSTYLRQPAPDETLDKAAAHYLLHGVAQT